jgi:hypothetical protein
MPESHAHDLDIVDTDPVRLAARTLVERLRATLYNDANDAPIPQLRTWWRYALDEPQATDEVMRFVRDVLQRHERQRETQKGRA